MDLTTGSVQEVPVLPGNFAVVGFDWSPDMEKLILYARNGSNINLFIYNLQTGQTFQLTNDPGRQWSPHWSPTGEWIAYQSDETGIFRNYLIKPDGSQKQLITPQLTIEQKNPNFSPDGQQIVFYARPTSTWEVFKTNLDGSNVIQLTNDPEVDSNHASWSPDGQFILFTRFNGITRSCIYKYHLENGQIIKILDTAYDEDHPHWR